MLMITVSMYQFVLLYVWSLYLSVCMCLHVCARVMLSDVLLRSSPSYVLLFMYVYMSIYACEWNSGDNPWESVLCFCHVSSRT